MTSSVQVFGGLVRGGPEHEVFGDPYTWAIGFITDHNDPRHVYLLAPYDENGDATKPNAVANRKAIYKALASIGVEAVTWIRKRSSGEDQMITQKLKLERLDE